MATQQLVIARHVTFDETKFPGRTLYNEYDESGSETSTEQSSDITVSDADADGIVGMYNWMHYSCSKFA